MSTRVSLSTRESISWSGVPSPSDGNHVLVLSGDSYYIDLRIQGEELEWGFAGQMIHVPPNIVKFTHEIDSRASHDVDQGAFVALDEFRERETGEMLNPASGKVEPYEEIWCRADLGPNPQLCIIRADDGHGTCFMGRVNGNCVSMSVSPRGFSYRRARLHDGTWTDVFSGGPDALDVLSDMPEQGLGDEFTRSGRTFTILERRY